MPSLGADMTQGTLLEWLVAPGDTVQRGQVIAVVDTEKSAVDVESWDEGVVQELVVQPGQKVPVGTVLATLTGGAEQAGREAPAAPPSAPAPTPPVAEAAVLTASPLVRHLAAERGLDLHEVHGSGRGGVVTRHDLDQAPPHPAAATALVHASPLARRLARELGVDLATVPTSGGAAVHADDVRRWAARSGEEQPAAAAAEPADRTEAMRRAIAGLTEQSNREIPHYYLSRDIDLAATLAWLQESNRERSPTAQLVPAAALLAAAARAAAAVPQLNGRWAEGRFRPAERVDLGLVVSLRRGGIMVPAIPAADELGVAELMARMRELVERARTGRLRGSDLVEPTITVSNLGDQGADSVLGVVYPPQVALLGFGAVRDRPWAVDGALAVHPVVTATLAADHRASDGAVGSRLLSHLDRLLQTPEEL